MTDETIQLFMARSRENLNRLGAQLSELERNPDDAELLAGIVRSVHTIKAASGFNGLSRLSLAAQGAENILTQIGDSEPSAKPPIFSLALEHVETMQRLLSEAENSVVESLSCNKIDSPAEPSLPRASAEPEIADSSIPAGVEEINGLIELVGELVMTRNQLLQLGRPGSETKLAQPIARLDRITAELRERVVKSAAGGTTAQLTFMTALIVDSGRECHAIPLADIIEIVRLRSDDRIDWIHNSPILRLRGRLVPLVSVDQGLDTEQGVCELARKTIIVVGIGDDQLGLLVSAVHDTLEIVVKPSGGLIHDRPIYRGTTILPDGRAIMVLDVVGVASSLGPAKSMARPFALTSSGSGIKPVQHVSFRVGSQLWAIGIEHVLEVLGARPMTNAPAGRPDVAGMFTHRGVIVAAIDLRRRLGLSPLEAGRTAMNLILQQSDASFSLLVDEVGDVVAFDATKMAKTPRHLDMSWKQLVSGIFPLERELLLVLDAAGLLTAP